MISKRKIGKIYNQFLMANGNVDTGVDRLNFIQL
jgi:hypothetical protein